MGTWKAFERHKGKFGQGELLVFLCAQNDMNEGLTCRKSERDLINL